MFGIKGILVVSNLTVKPAGLQEETAQPLFALDVHQKTRQKEPPATIKQRA